MIGTPRIKQEKPETPKHSVDNNMDVGTPHIKQEKDDASSNLQHSTYNTMEIGDHGKQEPGVVDLERNTDIENVMQVGTPTGTPVKSPLTTPGKALDKKLNRVLDSGHRRRSVSAGISKTPVKSSENPVVSEEISISPDVSRPLMQTRPSSSLANLSTLSVRSASDFRPLLHSTIFGGVDSPDIDDDHKNSSQSANSSRESRNGQNDSAENNINVENSPEVRKIRAPFRPIVEESPVKKHNTTVNRRYNVDDSEDEAMENGEENSDSVIIDESVIISDDEEKENMEPGNISVHDVQAILEKSLHHENYVVNTSNNEFGVRNEQKMEEDFSDSSDVKDNISEEMDDCVEENGDVEHNTNVEPEDDIETTENGANEHDISDPVHTENGAVEDTKVDAAEENNDDDVEEESFEEEEEDGNNFVIYF